MLKTNGNIKEDVLIACEELKQLSLYLNPEITTFSQNCKFILVNCQQFFVTF